MAVYVTFGLPGMAHVLAKRAHIGTVIACDDPCLHPPTSHRTYTRTMLNRFADMTEEELKRNTRGGGVYHGDSPYREEFTQPLVAVEELPMEVDWRKHWPPVITGVKDQGQCGSCCTYLHDAALALAQCSHTAHDAWRWTRLTTGARACRLCVPFSRCPRRNGVHRVLHCPGIRPVASVVAAASRVLHEEP